MNIYFLQFADGKYFKSRGMDSSAPRRVDKMEQAKPYTKIGPAKGQITRWKSLYPEFPAPLLVECAVVVSQKYDLSLQIDVKKAKELKKLVEEANKLRADYMAAPEPINWNDKSRIEAKERIRMYFENTVYNITKKLGGTDINSIGLEAISLN